MTTAATTPKQNIFNMPAEDLYKVLPSYNDVCQLTIEKRDMLVDLIRSLPEHYNEYTESKFAQKIEGFHLNRYNGTCLTGVYAGYCLSKGQTKRALAALAICVGMAEDAEHLKVINTLVLATLGFTTVYSGISWLLRCGPSKKQINRLEAQQHQVVPPVPNTPVKVHAQKPHASQIPNLNEAEVYEFVPPVSNTPVKVNAQKPHASQISNLDEAEEYEFVPPLPNTPVKPDAQQPHAPQTPNLKAAQPANPNAGTPKKGLFGNFWKGKN